jgi:hypothetical protein
MKQAYPNAEHFFARKQHYDPHGRFQSLWYQEYGKHFGQVLPTQAGPASSQTGLQTDSPLTSSKYTLREAAPRRSDSYRTLMADPALQRRFFESFLTQIFNIENPATLQVSIFMYPLC